MALTVLEQELLNTIERMERENRQREITLQQTMHNLTKQVTSLAEQVNGLHDLLQRVVQP